MRGSERWRRDLKAGCGRRGEKAAVPQHLTLGGTSSLLAWCSSLAWGWWRGGWGWGSVRAGDGWWWWWWWGSWERRWSCAKLEATPPDSLKDWERATTGGGGGEGAALLLLFRAARWDHWTFLGVRKRKSRGEGVKQADNTVRHEGRCVWLFT